MDVNARRPPLQRLVEDVGQVLDLLEAANPADFDRLFGLMAQVRRTLHQAAAQCEADAAPQGYCAAIREACGLLEASRWDARPNRDLEQALCAARDVLARHARASQ